MFELDQARATAELARTGGAIAALDADFDADQLDDLVRSALRAGIIECSDPLASLAVHPRSLVDPDPILAVGLGSGPTLLGSSLTMGPKQGESAADFTLRVLGVVVKAAEGVVKAYYADGCRGRDGSTDPN